MEMRTAFKSQFNFIEFHHGFPQQLYFEHDC